MTKQEAINEMRELEEYKGIIVAAQKSELENDIELDGDTIDVSQDCIDECMKLMLKDLEKQGFKFAPLEVAEKFSVEGHNQPKAKYTDQFGFHGNIISKKLIENKKICVIVIAVMVFAQMVNTVHVDV